MLGKLGLDGPVEVTGDAGDDLGELDRLGDVVDEVDEDSQVHEQERLGHGDREMGNEITLAKLVIDPSASTE